VVGFWPPGSGTDTYPRAWEAGMGWYGRLSRPDDRLLGIPSRRAGRDVSTVHYNCNWAFC